MLRIESSVRIFSLRRWRFSHLGAAVHIKHMKEMPAGTTVQAPKARQGDGGIHAFRHSRQNGHGQHIRDQERQP